MSNLKNKTLMLAENLRVLGLTMDAFILMSKDPEAEEKLESLIDSTMSELVTILTNSR